MLPLVIVNPQSAGGATKDVWPQIASDLRSHFGPFSIAFTSHPHEAIDLAATAARKNVPLVIACGGDGTISEVANGILLSGKDTEMGIIPSGTGGDFRRTVEIPKRTADAAEILRSRITHPIDVGRVTFVGQKGNEETRYFLNVASFGMSAEVIARAKDEDRGWMSARAPQWLSNKLSYGASMLRTAMSTTDTAFVVKIDDDNERHLKLTNLCVANARYFGGGMKIAPDAKLNDGLFDIVSIRDAGARKIVLNAPRLYSGTHLSMEEVSHTLAHKITARPANPDARISIEVDGELPGYLPATFQIVPAALRLRCP